MHHTKVEANQFILKNRLDCVAGLERSLVLLVLNQIFQTYNPFISLQKAEKLVHKTLFPRFCNTQTDTIYHLWKLFIQNNTLLLGLILHKRPASSIH